MNDTTLPIKGGRRPNQPRNKQGSGSLRPGFGLHDWMQLLRSAKDLSQRRGAPIRKDITLSEVQRHNKVYDGWIILRGKVYNIAPYLAYHPGGSAILEKCLGRDATVLFDKYHSWVNLDNLIGPLLLGYVMIEKKSDYDSDDDEDDGYLKGTNNDVENTTVGGSNNIVLPSASNAAASSSSSNNVENAQELEFAMPKPRPTKGSVISSLLVSNGNNDDDQEEENEEQLL